MSAPLSWRVKRLRAMGMREIAFRVRGALPQVTKRRPPDHPNWQDPSWQEFLVSFLTPERDGFAADAARIAAGELSFWGHDLRCPPSAPAWQHDPLTGRYVGLQSRDWGHDVKPVLELHHQQHLLGLAAGARLSGRQDWADVCVAQMLDWIAQNPAGRWPAWANGYEAIHRLVGWAMVVPLIAEMISSKQRDELAASYAAQVALTASQPSRYSSANNHRLGEIVGLLAADIVGVRTSGWEALWEELEKEIVLQTYADGGSLEQAAGYFLYVLEIVWFAGLMAFATGRPLGAVEERLTSMLTWLEGVADVRGEPPAFGDDTEDRIVRFRYFEPRRADEIAGRVRTLLTGFPRLSDESDPPPASAESQVLEPSGIAVFRSQIGDQPVRVITMFGELGLGSIAAHGHADALSVTVDVGDHQLLRDSGTYSYAPAEGRDEFRESSAHNTVTVDGLGQAEIWGPHLWGPRYTARLEAASLGPDLDYIRASHDGFRKHQSGALHVRSVIFLKPELLIVLDRVTARRSCRSDLAWHLMPGETPANLGGGLGVLSVGSSPVSTPSIEPARFSPRYRAEVPASCAVWTATGKEIIYASAIDLSATAESVPRIAHSDGVTIVQLEQLTIRETWRADAAELI